MSLDPPPAGSRRGPDKSVLLLVPLTVLLVAVLLVFYVFFQASIVEGDSMKPTLHTADRLLVTHGYDGPHRGDIIVFNLMEQGKQVEVVKRVVGLPGDLIETRGDYAWVDGKPEPIGFGIVAGPSERRIGPALVPTGTVFVLGDNRAISLDSRFIGPVPLTSVVGRAVAIFSPVTRMRMLDPGE